MDVGGPQVGEITRLAEVDKSPHLGPLYMEVGDPR